MIDFNSKIISYPFKEGALMFFLLDIGKYDIFGKHSHSLSSFKKDTIFIQNLPLFLLRNAQRE